MLPAPVVNHHIHSFCGSLQAIPHLAHQVCMPLGLPQVYPAPPPKKKKLGEAPRKEVRPPKDATPMRLLRREKKRKKKRSVSQCPAQRGQLLVWVAPSCRCTRDSLGILPLCFTVILKGFCALPVHAYFLSPAANKQTN